MLIPVLFPPTANAGLDCTVKSTQLIAGHSNIHLVPTTSPAIGDFIGVSNLYRVIYRCQVSGTPTLWTSAERNVSTTTNTGLVKQWNSTDVYPVLTTPQLSQYGLGFSGFFYPNNQWLIASRAISGTDQPTGVIWTALPPADSDGYVELDITAHYQYSKINDDLDAIINNPAIIQAAPFPLAAFLIHDNLASGPSDWSPIAQVTATMPTLTVAQRACTPFTNTVKLPLIYTDELNNINIGDSLPPTDFWIRMRCPSNLAQIGYYVQSPQGFENEAQGVIKINPSSSAKGIGLQITTRSISTPVYFTRDINATYQPLKFGPTNLYLAHGSLIFGAGPDTNPLTTETDHTAPDNTIPLRVAVYRTGTVVPGTYNASIFIHLVYR